MWGLVNFVVDSLRRTRREFLETGFFLRYYFSGWYTCRRITAAEGLLLSPPLMTDCLWLRAVGNVMFAIGSLLGYGVK